MIHLMYMSCQMSSPGLELLRITCLVSGGDWKCLAASHCFVKILPFILPFFIYLWAGDFFFLCPWARSTKWLLLWLFVDLPEEQQTASAKQERKERILLGGGFLGGQKWETGPRNDGWRKKSEKFHLAGLSTEEKTQLGPPSRALDPVSSKAKQWWQCMVIVLGGDGSIPQTTSSLPPFSAPEPPPTILWEAPVDFPRDGVRGALGNKHCLPKGSSIPNPKTGIGRWERGLIHAGN